MTGRSHYEAELIINSAEVPSSPLGTALRRARRARAFPEIAAGRKIELPPAVCDQRLDEGKRTGLSQEELDALCVDDEMPKYGSPRSERSSAEDAGELYGDDFLLRTRRMRAFLGASAAEAFAAEMMAKFADESQGSTAASTSPSRVSPRTADAADINDGMSQVELDRLCQKSMGLSQNELDALSMHHYSHADEACSGDSSPGPADTCYWIRRARAFRDREVSVVHAHEAHVTRNEVSFEEEQMDDDTIHSSMSSPTRRGKTQEELDKLCIESPDTCANSRSPKRDVDQIATPQRKRHSLVGGA